MKQKPTWTEAESSAFLKYGPYFVPDAAAQEQVLLHLIAAQPRRAQIVELCCGAGRWAEAVLRDFPESHLLALDGSPLMLEETARRCEAYARRLTLRPFDLATADWRDLREVDVFLSSLAIHHLDEAGKKSLFADLHRMLAPGGLFLLADIVLPTRPTGIILAARQWDEAVRRQLAGQPEAGRIFRFFKEDGWNFFDDPQADPIDRPSGLYDQLRWLEAAGFTDVDVFWMKAGHALLGGWKRS